MPNIGIGSGKPFNSCGVVRLCYVCHNPIIDGDYNWTFNPRTSTKGNPQYRHHICNVGKLWNSADYVEYKQRHKGPQPIGNPTQVNPQPQPPQPQPPIYQPPTPQPQPPTPLPVIEDPIEPEPQPTVQPATVVNAPVVDMWLALVRKARVICKTEQIEVSASPRVSLYGIDYLKAMQNKGLAPSREMVLRMFDRYLWEGLPQDAIGKALNDIKRLPEFTAFPQYQARITPTAQPAHILDAAYNLPLQHMQASDVLDTLKMNQFPFLWGNPGGGKTTLVQQIAAKLALPCRIITCAPDISKILVNGAISPINGNFIEGLVRDIWISGGFILFDECALAPGSFLNVLNVLLAQNRLDLADKSVHPRSANCFILFADNSNGHGDNPRYPERENMGSAFRNRLTYIEFQYDEELETAIAHDRYNKA